MSLSIMSSRFIHVVAGVRMSFFFEAEKYKQTTFCLSIHLLMDVWVVSTFSLWEYAAVGVGVQISLVF